MFEHRCQPQHPHLCTNIITVHQSTNMFTHYYSAPREGVIIECPLNELFHNVVTVIITSQIVVSKILLMVDLFNILMMLNIIIICNFSATTDWQKYNTRFSNYCFKFFGD